MKIWIKLLLGIIVGGVLSALLPATDGVREALGFVSTVVVRAGRFVAFPLVFFSLIMATHELKREKKVLATYGGTLAVLLTAPAILVMVGMATILLVSPSRIPIPVEEARAVSLMGWRELIMALVPANLFQIFSGDANLLLPLLALAVLLGMSLDFDKIATRLVIQMSDSLSRVFFHINGVIVELLGIGLIGVSAAFFMGLASYDLSPFRQLLVVLTVDTLVILGGLYPLLLYLFGGRRNPYKWVYASLGAGLAALAAGDVYFSLGVQIRLAKNSFGIPRTVGSTAHPLFAFLSRAGTAMVTSVTFLLILKSYSTLEVGLQEILWIMGSSYLLSFALGSVPGNGVFVALAILCGIYGQGRQDAYLIIMPIAPLLVSYGAFLDAVTAALGTYLVGRGHPDHTEIEARDFS